VSIADNVSIVVEIREPVAGDREIKRQGAEEEQEPDERYGGSMSRHHYFLQLREHNSLLRLILSLTILIAGLANLIRLEEENLAEAFVGVDLRRHSSKCFGATMVLLTLVKILNSSATRKSYP